MSQRRHHVHGTTATGGPPAINSSAGSSTFRSKPFSSRISPVAPTGTEIIPRSSVPAAWSVRLGLVYLSMAAGANTFSGASSLTMGNSTVQNGGNAGAGTLTLTGGAITGNGTTVAFSTRST